MEEETQKPNIKKPINTVRHAISFGIAFLVGLIGMGYLMSMFAFGGGNVGILWIILSFIIIFIIIGLGIVFKKK